jgi:hypothetical protein
MVAPTVPIAVATVVPRREPSPICSPRVGGSPVAGGEASGSDPAGSPKLARVVSERVISRRTRFADLLKTVLDPELTDKTATILDALVGDWNSST